MESAQEFLKLRGMSVSCILIIVFFNSISINVIYIYIIDLEQTSNFTVKLIPSERE